MNQFLFNKSIDSANLTMVKVLVAFTMKMMNDGKREEYPVTYVHWWLSYEELIPNIILISYPFLVMFILEYKRERLGERVIKDRIHSFYSSIHLKRNSWTIYYYPFWVIRRILFVYIPIIIAPYHPAI